MRFMLQMQLLGRQLKWFQLFFLPLVEFVRSVIRFDYFVVVVNHFLVCNELLVYFQELLLCIREYLLQSLLLLVILGS